MYMYMHCYFLPIWCSCVHCIHVHEIMGDPHSLPPSSLPPSPPSLPPSLSLPPLIGRHLLWLTQARGLAHPQPLLKFTRRPHLLLVLVVALLLVHHSRRESLGIDLHQEVSEGGRERKRERGREGRRERERERERVLQPSFSPTLLIPQGSVVNQVGAS